MVLRRSVIVFLALVGSAGAIFGMGKKKKEEEEAGLPSYTKLAKEAMAEASKGS